MAKHRQWDVNIAKRREVISQMSLRYGWSTRKICETMRAQPEMWNPITNKPWSQPTIVRDLQVLVDEWKAEAAKSMDEIQSNHLRSIRMAREQAWRNNEIGNVLRALKQESELYGMDAPKKIANTDPDGNPVAVEKPVLVLGGTREQYLETLKLMAHDAGTNGHSNS